MSDMPSVPQRACNDCGVVFDETSVQFAQYQKIKGGKYYYRHVCRVCWNIKRRAKMATLEHKQMKREQRARRKDKARDEKSRSQKRNREAGNARNRRYAANHPDRIRANTLNYQSRKRGAEGKHTAQDIDAQIVVQDGMCIYCGIRLYDEYEVDHYIPLSRGGSNNSDNLVATCPSCNSSKNNLLFDEWQARRGW